MQVVDCAIYERLRRRLKLLYGEQRCERLLERLDLLAGRYGVGACKRGDNGNALWDERDVVLITYGDMVRGAEEAPLRTLLYFLELQLRDAISAVHILPFFPYSSDDGFSVIDYRRVDSALGNWEDVQALSNRYRLMVDLVINHVSSKSAWFKAYSNGIAPERHYFKEIEPGTDLSAVTRPRTSSLLRPVQTPFGERFVWATFSHDQIDLDFSTPDVLFEMLDVLLYYVHNGARIIRLDAIAYLWKEIGTNCIHLPQTHEVVKLLRDVVEIFFPGVILLTETNVPHDENVSYFGAGDEAHMVYQFSLPPLLLHALETGDATHLARWVSELAPAPAGCTYFNFTASHDGIGMRPLEGLLPEAAFNELVARMEAKGAQVSRRTNPDGSETPYELNITYFDALRYEGDEQLGIERFICSQTIMLSLQGIPGIYFNSLFGTSNWTAGFEETGRARTLNRKKWVLDELQVAIAESGSVANRVFAEYLRRLNIRREQPAFHPNGPQRPFGLPRGVLGFERIAPEGSEHIAVVANLTAKPITLDLDLIGDATRRFDLITELELADVAGRITLAPYQVLWLMPQTA